MSFPIKYTTQQWAELSNLGLRDIKYNEETDEAILVIKDKTTRQYTRIPNASLIKSDWCSIMKAEINKFMERGLVE